MRGLLEAALEYQARGWSLIPVGLDKRPLNSWKSAQKTRPGPKTIRAAFHDPRAVGVGLVLGAISNVTVLDVEHTGLDFLTSLEPLIPPGTPRARSGGGGVHLYFAHAGERNHPINRDGAHLADLKGEGGYIVLPPSTHASGGVYEWLEPVSGTLAPMPEGLRAAILAETERPRAKTEPKPAPGGVGNYARAALESELEAVRTAPNGTRNKTLNTAAFNLGQLVGGGHLERGLVVGALLEAARLARLDDDEAERTIESGLSTGEKKPRDVPEPRERPVQLIAPQGSGRGSKGKGSKRSAAEKPPSNYTDEDGVLARWVWDDGNEEWKAVPLCNFRVRIVAETTRDDGAEKANLFTLEGTLAGGVPLERIEVPSAQFAGLSWVTERWGARAIVNPGQGTKDHLRAAIQMISNERGFDSRRVYAHTGWREIDGHGWVYLHAGGGIGADGSIPGLEVDLPASLRLYSLPDPPDGEALCADIRSSLGVLDVAPDSVSFPVWLAVWRAVLGKTRFSVFLYGVTGSAKSGFAALALQHFGAGFTRYELPGNWTSTDNALERLLFTLQDAVCVVDDFNPTGSSVDVKRWHAKAERVLRAQGNGQGRARMVSRSGGVYEQRPDNPPRGLCIVTGEEIPNGHSLRARNVILELAKGDVNLERLKERSREAKDGALARTMSAFLRWVAPRLSEVRAGFVDAALEHGHEFAAGHGRTTDAAAELLQTFKVWRAFALEVGAITEADADTFETRALDALKITTGAQAAHQSASDPVRRFLELLPALFSSGAAHLQDAASGDSPEGAERWGWRVRTVSGGDHERLEWVPQGRTVGWSAPDGSLYLEPEAAFAEVQRLSSTQGDALTKTQRALYKYMGERGLIAVESGQTTVKRSVKGASTARPRVIHLYAHALESENSEAENTAPQGRPQENRAFRADLENTVLDNGTPRPENEPALFQDQGESEILKRDHLEGPETEIGRDEKQGAESRALDDVYYLRPERPETLNPHTAPRALETTRTGGTAEWGE